MEASAPQVVGSLPPLEEFASPVYNQVHQERIVTVETTQNIVEIPAVQEQVIVQEIPQLPRRIVETIEVLPQERVELHTATQIVHVPVSQIQEQSAVTSLINPQISFTTVEAPQVVGSFPLSEGFAAPMYNQIHQEQIVVTVQPQAIVQEIPQLPVVEWIQEQIVETIEVFPQEQIEEHIGVIPVPQ